MNHILDLVAAREKDFPAALLEARKILRARVEGPHLDSQGDGEDLSLLAEIHYWLGVLSEDGRQKEDFLAGGVECGKTAATVAPDSVSANFWYASCMASHSRELGMTNCLFYLDPVELHGNLALEIDETYCNAGPLRLMGRFYSTAPVPPVGPGNRKKAMELARRAFELEPGYLGNKIVLAHACLSGRYFEKSRRLALEVLSASKPAGHSLSQARFMAEARQILDRLEKME